MVEFTEADLARELEESKNERQANVNAEGEGAASETASPKKRGPPRRKAGSSALNCVQIPAQEESDK